MPSRSLLFTPGSVHEHPEVCAPGRQEVKVTVRKNGRLYHLVMRDRIIPEDPYLVLLKAAAFSVAQEEPYMGRLVPRTVRDFLVKTGVVNR
jgi:hypothetical protein